MVDSKKNSNISRDWYKSNIWRKWESPLNIVRGESRYQDELISIAGPPCENGYLVPKEVVLIREPNNSFDKNAIKVEIEKKKVGYIAKELAEKIAPVFDSNKCKSLLIAGLIRGGFTNAPNFGVHLWINRQLNSNLDIPIDKKTLSSFKVKWPPEYDEGENEGDE
jgi:hypothetical protein